MFSGDSVSQNVGAWKFSARIEHILNSKCGSKFICDKSREKLAQKFQEDVRDTPRKTEDEVDQIKEKVWKKRDFCNFCQFDIILEMAHLPDMTYPDNYLLLEHDSGLSIEFNVIDALSPVIIKSIGLPVGMKVGLSAAWLKSRLDCEYTKNVHNAQFDWTFSTDYAGTLKTPDSSPLIEPTEERINFEKLMVRNPIIYFNDVDLFEDELADHGTAKCSVKIRVMADCFFVLLRYFLRIDNVFVRFYDTRYYHEFDKDYIIRERTNNESTVCDLNLKDEELYLLTSPNDLCARVPQTSLIVERIRIPKPTSESTEATPANENC